jgi:K+-sensing histidine kinase KdpD
MLQRAIATAVSLALLAATTAILFYIHTTQTAPHRLVYFYLLPVILIAVLFSGRLALACTGMAILAAAFFLQDPIYSFYNSNVLEYGDSIWFAVLAGLAIKTTRMVLPRRQREPFQRLRAACQPTTASGTASVEAKYGLMSRSGVSSTQSIPTMVSRLPSIRTRRATDSAIGLGRTGERSANVPRCSR